MTIVRRFAVLAALMFWQGGFTFYAAVVVPIGQATLPSPLDQGFITRQVTNYLNLSGIVALVVFAWDVWASRDRSFRWIQWLSWFLMAILLASLVWFHLVLDRQLDPEGMTILDPHNFRAIHRTYLWISTVQWAACVLYMASALLAWRNEDRQVT